MIEPNMHSVRQELFDATPREVWRMYFANGYTWARAINEELSCADTDECICGQVSK